jgi:hypothetical protein
MLNCLIEKGCTMAPEKQSSSGTTVVNQTTTPTPTAEETALNKGQLDIFNASKQDQMDMNSLAAQNVKTLLSGGQLPGNLASLSQGIGQNQMNAQAMQSGRLTNAMLNQGGVGDAGVGKVMLARSMSDSQNSNSQFNIQTLQQLLNQALGGQASVTGTYQNNTNTLASSLSGLRSINTSGTTNSNQTVTSMNPFLKSFQTSLGSGFGGGISKMAWGG